MNRVQKIFLDSGTADAGTSKIRPFWRGQLFLFDKQKAPAYSSAQGYRLLAILVFLEGIVRPLFKEVAKVWQIAARPWWPLLEMGLLTALACWLVVNFAKVRLSELGLYSWSHWSQIEKFYLLQIVPITVVVFSFTAATEMKTLWAHNSLGRIVLFVFVPQVIWGFYQEFLYRGLLQTELVRRWGSVIGILTSNLIFTFGPLHAYHFSAARRDPSHLWIFAGIFSIGLYFAVLYRRSGNLWIVGPLHGLGDFFIDGLGLASRMAR